MRKPFDSEFRVASPFGTRVDPITGAPGTWHGGVDLVSADRNVRAVIGGTVLHSRMVDKSTGDRTWEWGNYVAVGGDDGFVAYYCHLDARKVSEGRRIEAGEILGIEGNTGRSTGVHLHFEVRDWGNSQRDPCAYIGIPNKSGYVWEPERESWEDEVHDWSRDAVEWAVTRGILKGKGGDNFALGDPITREEMCVMLFRAREIM